MHTFEAPKGLSMWENGRVCGGLLCNMETSKFCRPRAWTPKQRCQRATTSSLSIRIGVSSGVEPSLCTPKVCRHNRPLGPFPLFPDRCRCWELTSLSTGAKSEFWTLRYAFNCWNLFFAFDFEDWWPGCLEIWRKQNQPKSSRANFQIEYIDIMSFSEWKWEQIWWTSSIF